MAYPAPPGDPDPTQIAGTVTASIPRPAPIGGSRSIRAGDAGGALAGYLDIVASVRALCRWERGRRRRDAAGRRSALSGPARSRPDRETGDRGLERRRRSLAPSAVASRLHGRVLHWQGMILGITPPTGTKRTCAPRSRWIRERCLPYPTGDSAPAPACARRAAPIHTSLGGPQHRGGLSRVVQYPGPP